MVITIELTSAEVKTLSLFLERLAFDHFLSCTDGSPSLSVSEGDVDQAYKIQDVVDKLEQELKKQHGAV